MASWPALPVVGAAHPDPVYDVNDHAFLNHCGVGRGSGCDDGVVVCCGCGVDVCPPLVCVPEAVGWQVEPGHIQLAAGDWKGGERKGGPEGKKGGERGEAVAPVRLWGVALGAQGRAARGLVPALVQALMAVG